MAFPSLEVLYEDYEFETTAYPYIPGFLAFKEVPSYLKLFERLKQNQPELYPQLCLVDGNGILHTRNFGIASHLGVLVDVPTIGVSKTVFYIDGITKHNVEKMAAERLREAGDTADIVGESGKTWGTALKPVSTAKDPLIVSQGHRVSL